MVGKLGLKVRYAEQALDNHLGKQENCRAFDSERAAARDAPSTLECKSKNMHLIVALTAFLLRT